MTDDWTRVLTEEDKADLQTQLTDLDNAIKALHKNFSYSENVGGTITSPIAAGSISINIQAVFYRSIDGRRTDHRNYSIRKNGAQIATATAVFRSDRAGGAGFGRSVNVPLQCRAWADVQINPGDKITVAVTGDSFPGGETLSEIFTVFIS